MHNKKDLCLVHTFTFVTSCLEKACKFCRAKIPNQHNNIGSENATRKLTPTPTTNKFLQCFELSAKIDLSFPFGVAVRSVSSLLPIT